MSRSNSPLIALILGFCASVADAEVCDYRLSTLASPTVTAGALAGGAAVLGTPAMMQVAGSYFISHATSRSLMLGSTLAGTSAAGTIGVLGGSGVAASVLAVLLAAVTLIAAGGTVAGVEVLGAGCYFVDERMTDPREVLDILIAMGRTPNEDLFKVILVGPEDTRATGNRTRVHLPNAEGNFDFYYPEYLYIVNGELLHRDWFRNTSGNISVAISDENSP